MSGILGIFTTGEIPERTVLQGMVASLAPRGIDQLELWCGEGAVLAVSRYEWELEAGFSGPVLVLEEDGCVVAADATLYHLVDLRRRLRAQGVEVEGSTPSHLILAAYRTWGEECTRWLEGDFAFILWDGRTRSLLSSRDFGGRRPLYYADLGDTLVLGSTVGAVLAHPSCPEDLDLAVLAATASALLSAAGAETCYRAIQLLPAASDLSWQPGGEPRISKHWVPTPAPGVADLSFGRAAEELLELLMTAVRERIDPEDPTTVWLSGGWDSTAVFGAGQELLRRVGRDRDSLRPVSLSYPVGDPGREDEYITQISEFWGLPVHWLDIDSIPLFMDRPAALAGSRDEPLAHLYEHAHRALMAGSLRCGSRVAFDGWGGDQLFQISDIYLADLLRTGQWLEFAREWQVKRDRGRRYLLRHSVRPLLPGWLLEGWGALRGERQVLLSHIERPVPSWIEDDMVERYGVIARERAEFSPTRGETLTDAEISFYLTLPLLSHVAHGIGAMVLEEGGELRSPLLDRRLVEFALARPRSERASRGETKHLLRRAMQGLLPAEVLAPRTHRTGITGAYMRREMRRAYPTLFEEVFRSPLVLAELGIVNTVELRRRVETYLAAGSDDDLRMSLFHTLQTEWWLRSRLRRAEVEGEVPELAVASI